MSRTVHLCLLSEQPSPNICPLLDSRVAAGEVVFVVSPQQQASVPRMETVLRPRGIRVSTLAIGDAYDFESIQSALDAELSRRRQNGDNVLINATGGTKPMSIAAYMAGYSQDVPVYYIQNDRLMWLHPPPTPVNADFDIEERLSLPSFLLAHGFRVQSCKPPGIRPDHLALFRQFVERDSYVSQVSTLNFLAWRAATVNTLTTKLEAAHIASQTFQAMVDQLQAVDLLVAGRDSLRFHSDDDRALCNGGWFEDFVFSEANGLRGDLLPTLQDVTRSLKVSGQGLGKTPVDNELDVALLNNNRLHIIECKTRHFDTAGNPEVDAALYKLAALTRNLGGSHARALFASFYPVADRDRRRADALGIALLDGPTALRMIRSRLLAWLRGDL